MASDVFDGAGSKDQPMIWIPRIVVILFLLALIPAAWVGAHIFRAINATHRIHRKNGKWVASSRDLRDGEGDSREPHKLETPVRLCAPATRISP